MRPYTSDCLQLPIPLSLRFTEREKFLMSRRALQVMMILTTIIASSGTARSESWAGTVKTVAFKTVEG